MAFVQRIMNEVLNITGIILSEVESNSTMSPNQTDYSSTTTYSTTILESTTTKVSKTQRPVSSDLLPTSLSTIESTTTSATSTSTGTTSTTTFSPVQLTTPFVTIMNKSFTPANRTFGDLGSDVVQTVRPVLAFQPTLPSSTESLSETSYSSSSLNPLAINSYQEDMMSPTAAILTAVPLSLLTIFIILGNLLVVLAVFQKKSLRTPQNVYIVSLAVTDMAVAVLVLPFNITTLILRRWIFGDIGCRLYLLMDVALCTISIFHLCAIGIDRYRAITGGITYVQKRNLKSVLTSITMLWILALWIGAPSITYSGDSAIQFDGVSCDMPRSPGFHIHLALGALFFPLAILIGIYWKIYGAIRIRLRQRARVTCLELTTSEMDSTDKLGDVTDDELTDHGTVSAPGIEKTKKVPSVQINSFLINRQRFSLSRERKAAKTLGLIMAAFIICWLPLGFLNIIGSLCPEHLKPPDIIFIIFTWLGYVNSALNPVIYGVSNIEFRKAFRRILKIDR